VGAAAYFGADADRHPSDEGFCAAAQAKGRAVFSLRAAAAAGVSCRSPLP
jgi:hypothetical protein